MSTYSTSAPRPASTVILARERGGRLQVYLLRRSGNSDFMPGTFVFPGGSVEPEDRDPWWAEHVDWKAPETPSGRGPGSSPAEALAHRIAAVRETFEEAGVFVAESGGPGSDWLNSLVRLRSRGRLARGWLNHRAASGGRPLAVSRLRRWSHWVTPPERKKRFDTRFFVVPMPDDQTCMTDGVETADGVWVSPGEALWGNQIGRLPLSPPTLVTLHELSGCSRMNELQGRLQGRTWGEARVPQVVYTPRGVLLLLPWDPSYRKEEREVLGCPTEPLESGAPFSRLLYRRNRWRPVRVGPAQF